MPFEVKVNPIVYVAVGLHLAYILANKTINFVKNAKKRG